jgi:alkylhydroperoxidase/carboxymuconolactone decarboxylase family protein YurZ
MPQADRKEQGAQLLRQMLGPEQAEQVRQAWQEICPDFEEYVVRFLAGEVWSRPGLDRRTKSLVTIATLAALGRPLGLELNIRMALNNGATRQEVIETLLHIAPYAGFPACWEGLATAHEVFRELDGKPEA